MPGGHKAEPITDPGEIALWESIIANQGCVFTTSGRGQRPGNPFTYNIRGAEMFVDRRVKSITRSTILIAWRKVREIEKRGGTITGPKTIGVHGDSYIFAIFKAFGVIQGDSKPKDSKQTEEENA